MNSGDPDQTPHYLASDLGLRCLPMFHKKDKVIPVNRYLNEKIILSSCMRVSGWFQIRPYNLSDMIWIQTVCKGYHHIYGHITTYICIVKKAFKMNS